MEVNNTRKLYDALKSDGYTDLGDFSSFEGKLKDSGKREMLYDVLKKDGWQDLGDFSQFESKLGYAPINNENIKETDYVSQSSVNPPPISLRQEVDIPKSDQSEYVNPWDNSADYNFESLRKKGKIETATPPPPTEYEKDSSFMNTWVGDAIQKLNAGGADLGAGIFGVLDKVSKGLESATGGLIPRGGAFKDISDRFKADAEFSRARSNRYNGKDFTDLWKEGNYMGAIGDIALQGVESLPMSIEAMAATMAGAPAAGLAGIGSIVASQKYDDLDQNNPNMGEFAKVSNAILTGTAESLSEMLGAGVSKAWMSTLFKTLGKEKAQEAIKRGIMGKMQEFYKKFGMFFEPVNEGIEEVSSTLAENITDKITGADPERDLTDGVLQSFVYGMGGGAYFTGAGALAKGAQYVADKIGGKQAQQPITDSNVTDQGVETPPILTKSRFAEAEEEGRNMTDPGDIRTASKKMEETRLSLSGMVPGLASTIESYVDDGASEAQVMSLLDGVNADARPLAEDFYADYLRISGLQDRIGEEIDNEVETYVANNITPYVTTNPDGQSILTTATLSEGNEVRPVYVRSIEGDKAVISDNGQDRMVSVKRLSDIVEQDAGHMRRTYEDQLLATRQSELDMTMHHNPKTQLPKPGLIIWNGDNAFILQGQDENGDWIAQPAAYDRETGQVTAKNGSSPAMPITENEILDLQDAIYDAQQVNVVSPENDNVASADAKITSAPPVEDAINQPTSEIETEGAIDQIAQPSNVENPSMVMREDGTPDFVSSGTDMTLDFLHDKYGDKMPRKIEVTRKSFDESLKKASDALEKAQEAYDDAPIGKEDKAEAALIKARQEYEAIKVEADFWANLDDDIKEASKKPGDVIAKEISVMGDPMSGEELAAMMLANGAIKLTRDSYKKETGAGNNETARMFGLFASPEKGGVNIERAGEILELADRENGTNFFDENDTNAGRDAIIEVLSSAHTRGDLIDYVKRNREAIAERERQAEYNAYAEWCEENYHMSPEEYEAYEESMARDFSEKQLTDEERGELDSQIVDEIQAIIDEQNEIDAILAQNKPIENENIEGNDESGGDGLREGGGEVLPREQLDQTGGTGEVEGRESAGPDIDRTDGATQEGSSRGLVPFVAPSPKENETPLDYAERIVEAKRLHEEELKVDTNPTEAQKEAGNYKKGHIKINGFDITIEQPSGSVRSGKDANGKEWSVTMNNTYGYIRGTESVDGDHIDVFLGPDMNSDIVYVVDQVNTDGSFDEHKVMMGFSSLEDARSAYLSNYEEGWQGLGNITGVALDEFKKWIDSSTRKTKPFYEYKGIKQEEGDISKNNDSDNYSIVPSQYTTKKGKVLDMRLLKFGNELSKEQQRAAKELAKAEKGWYDREQRGFMMRSDESARRLADTILGDTDAVSDAQPISLEDTRRVVEPQKVNVENLIGDINDKGKAKLSDRTVTPSGNRLVTDERYAELRERMRRKLGGQMNMGVDPEILAIGTEMAVYHIEKGLRKFSDYSKAMIDDLGDAIRPYLKAFYNGARDLPEVGDNGWDKDMTAYEDVRSFDVANFDKPVPDIMDAAETVVRETEIARQASAAKKKIKNSRKKQTDNKDKPLPLYGNDLFTPNNIKDNEQGNSRADQGVGRKAREEDRGSERGGDRGGVHGSDVLDTERGRGIPISDSDKRPVVRNQNNFSFPEKGIELPSGDISKLKANIEAIETLKDVEDGQGKPTPEQQAKMSRYVGWGGLAEALNEGKYNARDNNWTKDRNWNDKYLRYYEKLKSLLSKEEFDSAVRSTTTSHYTPSEVVESLWGITEKLGFKGGNISEPAMGIGNIIGMMPKSISEKSSISGFEIDSLSGRMAKALYPDANIKVQGYEKAFSPNSKDLVITNVPFGKNAPYDKVLDKQFRKKLGSSYNLHNYFILKGLLELKEGGLGVFVTSSATMDGADSKFREYVSGNGYDLVGAIRLPNDAFQKGAGTSVTADIVIFRKRKYGEPSNGIGFTTTTQIGEGTYMEDGDKRSKPIMVNEYFSNHPDMMLGDMMTAYDAGSGGLYSGASQTLKAKPGADLSKELLNAIDNLPKNILSGVVETKGPEVVDDSTLKDGTITVQNGNVFVLDGDSLKPIKANPTFVHNGKTRKIADAVNDYNDIKEKLIKGGIPSNQIAIVGNYEGERRNALFDKVRNGDVRILIGSTEKMGVGVNVQDRLFALHHIDAPIRPMDFEQRNGRILRQGNLYATWDKPVNIVTYGVKGTLDATAYDRLRIKQNFINQMMKGDISSRVMEEQDDSDPSGMTFSEMAATLSGDKTAQLLFVAQNKLKKLQNSKRSDLNSKSSMRDSISKSKLRIQEYNSRKDIMERNANIVKENFPDGVESVTVKGNTFSDGISNELTPIIDDYYDRYTLDRNTPPLKISLNGGKGEAIVHFNEGMMVYSLYLGKEKLVENRDFSGGRGLMASIDRQLGIPAKSVSDIATKIKAEENKIAGLEEAVKKPWGKEDELNAAQAEVNDLQRQLVEKAKAEDIQLESTLDVDGTLVKEEGETRFRFMGVDTTNNQDNVSSIESSINGWSNKLNTPVRVIHDVDDITDTDENMLARKRDSKGWYDTSTGEIVIVSPNSTSVGDAQRTFLHEVVGHHGLRELFGDDFDTFLDNVYRNANEDIRKNIIDRTKGNPLNLREATEEYIAELAERGFDNKAERSLWEKIKDSFLDMLRKAGISLDFKLSDNDLRYILWRSYKNLEQGNLMDVAEDIVMRNRLSLNNINLNENGSIARDIEPEKGKQPSETKSTGRELETIDGVDENGNESERDHIDKPRGVENAIDGTENATDRNGKKTDGQVDNDGDQLGGGDTGDRNGSVRDGIGGDRTVIGRAGSENKGRGVGESVREKTDDFAFAEKTKKNNDKIRFREAKAEVEDEEPLNKEMVDAWDKVASSDSFKFKEAMVDSLTAIDEFLKLLAKKTKSKILDYENPYYSLIALSSKNKVDMDSFDSKFLNPLNEAIRALIGDASEVSKKGLRRTWDWSKGALRDLVKYVQAKHGIERNRDMSVRDGIETLKAFDVDALSKMGVISESDLKNAKKTAENVAEEKGSEAYKKTYDKVLAKELKKGVDKEKAERSAEIAADYRKSLVKSEIYNKEMDKYKEKVTGTLIDRWEDSKKDILNKDLAWDEEQKELDREALSFQWKLGDNSYGVILGKDYSGLSSVFKPSEDGANKDKWLSDAYDFVRDYESTHNMVLVDNLWDKVHNVSEYTLRRQYESGLISKSYMDKNLSRFKYFIPLRGFSDNIASDVYDYIDATEIKMGNPVKTAKGRISEADNPFAGLIHVGYGSITAGNRNLAKQRFLNLASNHDTGGLITIDNIWVRNVGTEENPEWVESIPQIPDNASGEEVAKAVKDHEEMMRELREEGKAELIKGGRSDIPYKTLYDQRSQHQVQVFVGGNRYVMTVNGNPRLAQAVNGLTNPDVKDDLAYVVARNLKTFMAGAFTSKNVAFSFANLIRDTPYANNSVFVTENFRYFKDFSGNQRRALFGLRSLGRNLYKYRRGEIDISDKEQAIFKEFMDNGGATGYTFVETQKEYAKDLANKLEKLSDGNIGKLSPKELVSTVFECFEFMGNVAELVNRYAAYKTSREHGRSIDRSINDAKEVSVNFNKKGAGKKTKSDKWYINTAAWISEYGRDWVLFFNAAVQSMYKEYSMLRNHPIKGISSRIAPLIFMGSSVSLLNNLFMPMLFAYLGWDSDDDDRDYFDSLSDHERQNNICIRLTHGRWLKIPLSPELANYFKIGDIIAGQLSGKREVEAMDVVKTGIDMVSPLNINWEYDSWKFALNLLPTVVQPIAQNASNVNFMGNPIYKTSMNKTNDYDPEYTKVYRSTSTTMVELSRALNSLTGGDDVKRGTSFNPATWQNILSGYTGGFGTVALGVSDLVLDMLSGENGDMPVSRYPLLSRFLTGGDKDLKLSRMNSIYNKKVVDFISEMDHDYKGYLKKIQDTSVDDFDRAGYMVKLNQLTGSDDYRRSMVLSQYVKAISDMERFLREVGSDNDSLENQVYELKLQALEIFEDSDE